MVAVVAVKLLVNILVKYPVIVFNRLVKKLVLVAEVNIGVSVNEYVTSPLVVVDTVKLLLVDDARKVYRLAIDVVATTPLTFVVTIPLAAEILLLLMIFVLEDTPLIVEVRVFTADTRLFVFTKLAVVVATLPFTVEVNVKVLVEVDTVNVLLVEDATRLVKSVDVATPFTMVVRVAPLVKISFDLITVVVADTPLIVVVRIFPVTL